MENDTLKQEILSIINSIQIADDVRQEFTNFLKQQGLTIEDDEDNHLVVSCIPILQSDKSVLLVKNLGTNLWLVPAGYVEKDMNLQDNMKRELRKEVSLSDIPVSDAFFLSVTNCTSKRRNCKKHYDVWFTCEVENAEMIQIAEDELGDKKWLNIDEAIKFVVDKSIKDALIHLKHLYGLCPIQNDRQ